MIASLNCVQQGIHKKRILIVEDEPDLADIHRRTVLHMKMEPTVVSTGAEAVRLAAEHEFDLLIMDLHLPDGNGMDFFELIMANNPGQRILIVSGSAYDDDPRTRRASGVLQKPFQLDLLMDAIRRLADGQLLGFINPPVR